MLREARRRYGLLLVMMLLSVVTVSSGYAATPAASPVPDSPLAFYRSLVAGISSAKGNILLELTAGHWKSKIGSNTVKWTNDQSTKALVSFDYSDGVLQGAAISFTPPVHIWADSASGGFSIGVRSIKYDRFGGWEDWDVFFDNTKAKPAPLNPNALAPIKRALEIGRSPSELFSGQLLVGYKAAQHCESTYTSCTATPMVERVRLVRLDRTQPALRVDFKPQATLILSQSTTSGRFDNFVVVRTGSFEFEDVDFTVADQHIHGTLASIDFTAERGRIATRDLDLQMRGGSRLTFNHVEFRRESDGISEIDAELGWLSAAVGAGSRIALSTGSSNASHLVFDDGTELVLNGFKVVVNDKRATQIQIGGGSTMHAVVRDGRLGLGQSGYVQLQSGNLVGSLAGTWDSSLRPDASLDFSVFDIVLAGGEVELNSATRMGLTGGSLKSSDLRFRGVTFGGIVGRLSDAHLTFAEGSQFGVPGGLQLTTAVGASLLAGSGDQLELKSGVPYPVGTYEVELPFKRFANSTAATFALADGLFKMKLLAGPDGSIKGSGGTGRGTLTLESSLGMLRGSVELDRISVERTSSGEFTLAAAMWGAIEPGLAISITSPFLRGYKDEGGQNHDNFRGWPLTVNALVPAQTSIPQSALRFKNGAVTLDQVTLHPVFRLEVPGGKGEHQQWDDPNSADGSHGPDSLKSWQEAAFDTFPGCHAHAYVKPTTYQATGSLTFSIDQSQVKLLLSDLALDRQVEFEKDGCDLQQMLAFAGALGGYVVAGPVGSGAAAVVGWSKGGAFENQIHAAVAGLIARKLRDYTQEWRVRIPAG